MSMPLSPAVEAMIVAELAERQHNRAKYMGGSDMAAVMGLSPWATPVELWMQKTGRAPREEPTPRQAKVYARGHKLEPFIRDMVIDRLVDEGVQVELIACNERYYDPEYPWMSVEIDFELRLTGTVLIGDTEVVFDREHINADAKSVSGFAKKKWGMENTEDVPIEYAIQFTGGMMVTGRRYCLVAALRSFDDVDIYWTVRDDETIAGMRPKLVDFWVNHVLGDVAPDPIKFSDIKALFPLDNGLAVEATEEVMEWVARLRQTKDQLKDLKGIEERLTFEIADFIRPHARLLYRGREVMTYRGQTHTDLNAEALRLAEPAIAERFTRTQVIRVLRHARPKKGSIR